MGLVIDRVLSGIIDHLHDRHDREFRINAVQPLRQIACKYYAPAVKAITARLEDSDWKVRKAALLASFVSLARAV